MLLKRLQNTYSVTISRIVYNLIRNFKEFCQNKSENKFVKKIINRKFCLHAKLFDELMHATSVVFLLLVKKSAKKNGDRYVFRTLLG